MLYRLVKFMHSLSTVAHRISMTAAMTFTLQNEPFWLVPHTSQALSHC